LSGHQRKARTRLDLARRCPGTLLSALRFPVRFGARSIEFARGFVRRARPECSSGKPARPGALLRALPHRFGRRRSTDQVLATTASRLAPSPALDAMMARWLRIETAIGRKVRLPIGLSVAGLSRARSNG
jgi:hypothetical protein